MDTNTSDFHCNKPVAAIEAEHQRPPLGSACPPRRLSRHRNPVVRALRDNRGRYVRIVLKETGETLFAFIFWMADAGAVLRPTGAATARHIRYSEIAAAEGVVGEAPPFCERCTATITAPEERESNRHKGRALCWSCLREALAEIGAEALYALDRTPRPDDRLPVYVGPAPETLDEARRVLDGLGREFRRIPEPVAMRIYQIYKTAGLAEWR